MEHNEHLKLLRQAREFALEKHGDQMYGDKPYSFHLDRVYHMVISKDDHDRKHLHICAYLHDLLEDTNTTFKEIEDLFGSVVARMVFLLTKKEDEAYPDYIERVKKDRDATFLKACDLGANLYYLDTTDLGFIRKERLKNKYIYTMIQLADI